MLIFMVSCGKDVNLSNSKLESISEITEGSASKVQNSGVLLRKASSTTQDRIQYNGQYYNVSMHSAYNALEFIAAKPLGSSVNVKFKGKTVNREMLLQEIE